MSGIDARYDAEIFRKDHPVILACNRHQALLLSARMRYKSGGYVAGTLIAQNSVDDLFDAYDNSASSGLNTAKAILNETVDFGAQTSGSLMAVGIFKGTVYKDKLTGYDAPGLVDLNGREVTDSDGDDLVIF